MRSQSSVQATGANTTPVGQGPVGVAAHQAEALDDMDCTAEAMEDEWNLGDEDTEFKTVYACEKCAEGNDEWTAEDEAYVAAKRTSVEIESDEEVREPQPRKTRKAGPKVGWSNGRLDMSQGNLPQQGTQGQSNQPTDDRQANSRESTTPLSDSTLQHQSPLRAQPLAPSLKTAPKAPRRGTPPVLKPRGMGHQESWSAADWTQNTKVEISVAQLMQIAPKARASMVEAIRLEPNPNRKAAQRKKKVRIEEASQAEEVVKHEAHQVQMFDEDQSEGEMSMRNKSLTHGKLDSENLNSAYSQRHGKGNFYTSAVIKPRKRQSTEYEVKKVLIDPGATLNLIPLRMVEKMACITYVDESMIIKVANGAYQRLLGFARFMIDVAGVRKIIEAFIVPGDTSYSLILGRPWLRSVKAIGLYEHDEYWIQDVVGEHHQLEVSGKARIKAPEVFLAEDADLSTLDIDEEILVDLEYSEEERAEAIMQEILEQAEEEMWNDYEEDLEEEERFQELSGKVER